MSINKEKKESYIGLKKKNYQGYIMEIVDYVNYYDISVMFNDSVKTVVKNRSMCSFKKGDLKNPNYRLGLKSYDSYGCEIEIIMYNNVKDMIVRFNDNHKYETRCTFLQFQKGIITNPFSRSVYSIGYLGDGEYSKKTHTKIYSVWSGIIKRLRGIGRTSSSYSDVSISEEWLNFQNFAKWYDENYYEIEGQEMDVDKDILFKNCRLYSEETCLIVPHEINMLFVGEKSNRGKYPIGVSIEKTTGRLRARLKKNNKEVWLGTFDNEQDAFMAYKIAKEKHIKDIADKYRDEIPKKLHDAMYKYKVEITD